MGGRQQTETAKTHYSSVLECPWGALAGVFKSKKTQRLSFFDGQSKFDVYS